MKKTYELEVNGRKFKCEVDIKEFLKTETCTLYKIDEAKCKTTTKIDGKKLEAFIDTYIDMYSEGFDLFERFLYDYKELNPCLIVYGKDVFWGKISRNTIEIQFNNPTDARIEEWYKTGELDEFISILFWFYKDFQIVDVHESIYALVWLRLKNVHEMLKKAKGECNKLLKNAKKVVDIVDNLCHDIDKYDYVDDAISLAFFGVDWYKAIMERCSVDPEKRIIEAEFSIDIDPIVLKRGKEEELDEYIRREIRKKLS